jgi:SpoVK/Ycf46/Vps4 family AAA+-type ATPase
MAELDGLEDRGNILVLAATNRRGALDPALLRPGRLGDLILEIPRPNKEGTVDIFGKYLTENTPFAPLNEESPESIRQHIIGLAVEKIFTSNGATDLARVMLADGRAQIVERSDLVTGAVVAKIAQSAIEKACVREIQGGEPLGVTPGDVLSSVDEEFRVMASTLTRDNIRRYIPAIPDGIQVGSVEVLDKQTAPAEPVAAEQNGGEDVRA